MNAQELHKKLLASTIGGSTKDERLGLEAVEAFTLYVQNAFNDKVEVKNLELLYSKVSLNSIIANATMQFDGFDTPVFLKIHIEANTKGQSALGDDKEYGNAKLLEECGWPILAPLTKNTNPEYPLLVYPRIDAPTLFNLIEESYGEKNNITNDILDSFTASQKVIGRATVLTLKECAVQTVINAPVQTLFLERFKIGGRLDQWYTDSTVFALPGLSKPTAWSILKNAKWNINGELYSKTLAEIIESARKSLSFSGENSALCATSHGDDHSGNVFIELSKNQAILFDPAFAGENPFTLCDTKALAHIGYMMMGGMYFDPKLKNPLYRFDEETNTIFAFVDYRSTPLFNEHEEMARQIIDDRIIPMFRKARDMGGDIKKEIIRQKDALSGCPLLTINIPKLLDSKDGRGMGLLPLVIMLNELNGLPSLKYLSEKLNKI
ncbi:MAG: hypothetical protein KBC17_00675 [Candidatus Pacebacteria bacterium]|nr:hypothetical protein [Candidatus Paceibacterota bacterium]